MSPALQSSVGSCRSSAGWSLLVRYSGEHPLQLVERPRPTVAVPVARGLVPEALVREGEPAALARRLDLDRDEGLPLRCRFPGPGEDQLPSGHDLPVDAAHAMLLAVRRAGHD